MNPLDTQVLSDSELIHYAGLSDSNNLVRLSELAETRINIDDIFDLNIDQLETIILSLENVKYYLDSLVSFYNITFSAHVDISADMHDQFMDYIKTILSSIEETEREIQNAIENQKDLTK